MAVRRSGFCSCFNFFYIIWPCINHLLPVNNFLCKIRNMMLQVTQNLPWKNTIAFIWCYRIHEMPKYMGHLTAPCPLVIYDNVVTVSRGQDRRSFYYRMANITRGAAYWKNHIAFSWNPPLTVAKWTWKTSELLEKSITILLWMSSPWRIMI